jgi:hypothetical protein
MKSEGEVPSLATALLEPISTSNDDFGSRKEKFVFIPRTISLVHVQDDFIMHSKHKSQLDFIYVHKVHKCNAFLRENTSACVIVKSNYFSVSLMFLPILNKI